jgi:hypothetical protein
MSRNGFVLGALSVVFLIAAAGVGVSQSETAAPPGRQFTPPWWVASPDVQPDFVLQQGGAIGFDPFVNDFAGTRSSR